MIYDQHDYKLARAERGGLDATGLNRDIRPQLSRNSLFAESYVFICLPSHGDEYFDDDDDDNNRLKTLSFVP